jgi:transcription elongation factor Elf1
MVQTWHSGSGETHTCPHCGAVYEVRIRHLPDREQDDAYCDVCGEVMAEWDNTAVPAFTLVQKPEHPPSDEDNPE